MQWNSTANAGFTGAKPWFYVNSNYPEVNVEREEQDPNSILHFYRRCLALRKGSRTLLWGTYREYGRYRRRLYVYERSLDGERILVVCSFSGLDQSYRLPGGLAEDQAELLLCNYPEVGTVGTLRPYEVRVLRWK